MRRLGLTVLSVGVIACAARGTDERAAYAAQYEAPHRESAERARLREERLTQERIEEEERYRAALAAQEAKLAAEAEEQDRKKREQEERERLEAGSLRASCAADRQARYEQRRRDKQRDEERRAAQAKLVEYRKKYCKVYERGVPVLGDGVEWDDDGYLRRPRGVGLEVYLECPTNGPPGARGRVSLGVQAGGSGDPSRIARLSSASRRPVFPRERDNQCWEADEEDAAAGGTPLPER